MRGLVRPAITLALLTSACALPHRMGRIPPCNPGPSALELSWLGPSDPHERESTAVRCQTVGSPLARPAPGAPFPAPEPNDSLAVFSWNIDVGAGDLLSFLEEEVDLSSRGTGSTPSARLPNFVVLVQEAFREVADLPPANDPHLTPRKRRHDPRPGGDPDIAAVADSCGLAFLYGPSGRNGVDEPGEKLFHKGNAILSSLPLSDFLAVVHPFETERKVAVGATVSLPRSGSLRLMNVHLEVTSSFYRTLLTGNQTRLRKVDGLIEALSA